MPADRIELAARIWDSIEDDEFLGRFALVDASNNVIEFLSYEGTFTATDGAAIGLTSTDVGVAESGSTQSTESLQRIGTGRFAEDFTWVGPSAASAGSINAGQTFVCALSVYCVAIPYSLLARRYALVFYLSASICVICGPHRRQADASENRPNLGD